MGRTGTTCHDERSVPREGPAVVGRDVLEAPVPPRLVPHEHHLLEVASVEAVQRCPPLRGEGGAKVIEPARSTPTGTVTMAWVPSNTAPAASTVTPPSGSWVLVVTGCSSRMSSPSARASIQPP